MAKAAPKAPTKTEIFTNIATVTGLTKKQVSDVFNALGEEIKKAVSSKGPGVFAVPGLCKVTLVKKPATKEKQGINPFTKEPMTIKAKPARNVIRLRPLKTLKDMVPGSK